MVLAFVRLQNHNVVPVRLRRIFCQLKRPFHRVQILGRIDLPVSCGIKIFRVTYINAILTILNHNIFVCPSHIYQIYILPKRDKDES